jgi:fructuronate reductase
LGALPAAVARPSYARAAENPAGVVHLGIGAFHRAHQGAYFDALMRLGEPGWMIRAASLRAPNAAAQLNPQQGLYTLVERDGAEARLRVIGALREVLVAPADPGALVAALARPEVALVTLTVTEKGYGLDPATGALNAQDPAIAADLASLAQPCSTPGFLAAGLAARRAAGLAPFTVLSCDNLPNNGARTRAAVLALAGRHDPGLADWIGAEGAFPSSMVDRIVPATTETDIAALSEAAGYDDPGMIKTEPFSQWVVEDAFCARRPGLERVGVQFTRDVSAWEHVKLRLLNGAHSALAYLGALAGHAFVHQAIAAPGFVRYLGALWNEAASTLAPIDGFDPAAYRAALLARFANAALAHRTTQIAMDGSQKLPQRLLASIRTRLARGQASPALTLAVAGWMRWQSGVDEQGRIFVVEDPLAARTAAALRSAGSDAEARVAALLAIPDVFGADLAQAPGLVAALVRALARLEAKGAARTVLDFRRDEEEAP